MTIDYNEIIKLFPDLRDQQEILTLIKKEVNTSTLTPVKRGRIINAGTLEATIERLNNKGFREDEANKDIYEAIEVAITLYTNAKKGATVAPTRNIAKAATGTLEAAVASRAAAAAALEEKMLPPSPPGMPITQTSNSNSVAAAGASASAGEKRKVAPPAPPPPPRRPAQQAEKTPVSPPAPPPQIVKWIYPREVEANLTSDYFLLDSINLEDGLIADSLAIKLLDWKFLVNQVMNNIENEDALEEITNIENSISKELNIKTVRINLLEINPTKTRWAEQVKNGIDIHIAKKIESGFNQSSGSASTDRESVLPAAGASKSQASGAVPPHSLERPSQAAAPAKLTAYPDGFLTDAKTVYDWIGKTTLVAKIPNLRDFKFLCGRVQNHNLERIDANMNQFTELLPKILNHFGITETNEAKTNWAKVITDHLKTEYTTTQITKRANPPYNEEGISRIKSVVERFIEEENPDDKKIEDFIDLIIRPEQSITTPETAVDGNTDSSGRSSPSTASPPPAAAEELVPNPRIILMCALLTHKLPEKEETKIYDKLIPAIKKANIANNQILPYTKAIENALNQHLRSAATGVGPNIVRMFRGKHLVEEGDHTIKAIDLNKIAEAITDGSVLNYPTKGRSR